MKKRNTLYYHRNYWGFRYLYIFNLQLDISNETIDCPCVTFIVRTIRNLSQCTIYLFDLSFPENYQSIPFYTEVSKGFIKLIDSCTQVNIGRLTEQHSRNIRRSSGVFFAPLTQSPLYLQQLPYWSKQHIAWLFFLQLEASFVILYLFLFKIIFT